MQIVQVFAENGMVFSGRLIDEQTFEDFADQVFGGTHESVVVETQLRNQADDTTVWVSQEIRAHKIVSVVKMPTDHMVALEGGGQVQELHPSQENFGDAQEATGPIG